MSDPGSARWLTKQPGYLKASDASIRDAWRRIGVELDRAPEPENWRAIFRDSLALAYILFCALVFLWWLA